MNYDLLSLILFYALLYLFYLRHKDKFMVQGKILFMYRTKIGLKLMDSFAGKYPRIVKVLGFFGVVVGFAGMGFIFVYLIKETISFLITPDAIAPLAPVLPGVKIPGVPLLSFWHWVVSILIVASIHEFSHGLLSRLHKIKIKSSGFAFLGPMLMAFVEPDEKTLRKAKPYRQMAVYAAGPFSNILMGLLLFVLLAFAISPAYSALYEVHGINVTNITAGFPVSEAGLTSPFILTEIDGVKIIDIESLANATSSLRIGSSFQMTTDKGIYDIIPVADPKNATRPVIGITNFDFNLRFKESISWVKPLLPVIKWFNMLLLWLFMISIGVALFNLLPFGPVDGGRMFYTAMFAIFKNEKKAKRIWGFFSGICILLIVINLLPWIIKLLLFILSKLVWVFNLFAA